MVLDIKGFPDETCRNRVTFEFPYGETGPHFSKEFCNQVKSWKPALTDTVENKRINYEWLYICTICGLIDVPELESEYEDMTSSYMEKIIPTLDDFKHTISEPYDIDEIFSKFGPPHDDIGSGIHIYVYDLNDLTEIWIGYTDHVLYVKHIDSNGNLLEELFVENEI